MVSLVHDGELYDNLDPELKELVYEAAKLLDYRLTEEVDVVVTLRATVELPKKVVDGTESLDVSGYPSLDVNGEEIDFDVYDYEIEE